MKKGSFASCVGEKENKNKNFADKRKALIYLDAAEKVHFNVDSLWPVGR